MALWWKNVVLYFVVSKALFTVLLLNFLEYRL